MKRSILVIVMALIICIGIAPVEAMTYEYSGAGFTVDPSLGIQAEEGGEQLMFEDGSVPVLIDASYDFSADILNVDFITLNESQAEYKVYVYTSRNPGSLNNGTIEKNGQTFYKLHPITLLDNRMTVLPYQEEKVLINGNLSIIDLYASYVIPGGDILYIGIEAFRGNSHTASGVSNLKKIVVGGSQPSPYIPPDNFNVRPIDIKPADLFLDLSWDSQEAVKSYQLELFVQNNNNVSSMGTLILSEGGAGSDEDVPFHTVNNSSVVNDLAVHIIQPGEQQFIETDQGVIAQGIQPGDRLLLRLIPILPASEPITSETPGAETSFIFSKDDPQIKREPSINASNVVKTAKTRSQSFTLGATTNGGKLSYKSSNKKVKVSSSGKVTIPGNFTGKVYINITSAETENYLKGTKKISITVDPAKTAFVSVVRSRKVGTVKATWKKTPITTTTGYQIQYSTSAWFAKAATNIVTVKGRANTSKLISGLKKNKKYYFKVRTYKKTSSATYYSDWSEVKYCKTRK